MQYILLDDLKHPSDGDDGIYMMPLHAAGDDREESMEVFSEGDLWHIKTFAPLEADAIAKVDDDWFYYNTENGLFFEHVFPMAP
jgi:hypothetical protein